MLEIVKPGLETSIQDFPGRVGYWNQGFPPSGPMDMWSFRLANLVVGNDEGAPGSGGPVHGADDQIPARRRDRRDRREHAPDPRRAADSRCGRA